MPDRVIVNHKEKNAVGYLDVDNNTALMQEHGGILPGVISMEFAQQVALVLLNELSPGATATARDFSIENVPKMVVNGDRLVAGLSVCGNNIDYKKQKGDALVEGSLFKENDDDNLTYFSLRADVMKSTTLKRIIKRATKT